MFLDLKAPTLVVTGHWNPRIFEESWIAQNLFEKKVGETVEMGQIAEVPVTPWVATFVDGIGVRCKPDRFEVFMSAADDGGRAEAVLSRALEFLRHTPIHGLGVNFLFRAADVEASIADKLKTPEAFDANEKVVSIDFKTTLERKGGESLNVMRRISPDGVEIALNFHREVKSTDALLKLLSGLINQKKKEADNLLQQYYGVTSCDVTGFSFGHEEGDGNG